MEYAIISKYLHSKVTCKCHRKHNFEGKIHEITEFQKSIIDRRLENMCQCHFSNKYDFKHK